MCQSSYTLPIWHNKLFCFSFCFPTGSHYIMELVIQSRYASDSQDPHITHRMEINITKLLTLQLTTELVCRIQCCNSVGVSFCVVGCFDFHLLSFWRERKRLGRRRENEYEIEYVQGLKHLERIQEEKHDQNILHENL